jgi:hypothetical protein
VAIKRKGRGGARPGSGRPPSNRTEKLRFTVLRETAAKLRRLAKLKGFQKYNGGPSFLGRVVDDLVATVETPEPEYMKLVTRR